MTTAEKLNQFNASLDFTAQLPEGFKVMNPFKDSPAAVKASTEFNNKYYNNNNKRKMILAICPGRFGAGVTGISLTDPHHLRDVCKIEFEGNDTYEISSVFFYDMINAYGGPEKFYNDFYVNAVCPLGILIHNEKDHWVNSSYYETPEVLKATTPFIKETMKQQVQFDVDTSKVFCLGMTNNYDNLMKINKEENYFGEIVALEHPRYIAEYKRKEEQKYIDEYLNAFAS